MNLDFVELDCLGKFFVEAVFRKSKVGRAVPNRTALRRADRVKSDGDITKIVTFYSW